MNNEEAQRAWTALQAADAAGDKEAATFLANRLRTWQTDIPRQVRMADLKAKNPGEYDPESKDFKAKYGPLGSNLQNTLAGAGKAYVDIGRGVKQLTGNMTREEVDETRRLDAPLMGTKAGIGGNIAGSLVTTAPAMFVPGVNTVAGAAALGGGIGAAQPVGTEDSRLLNTGFGAAGGLAGKFGGDKISNWASRSRVTQGSPERLAALASAQSQGGAAGASNSLSGSLNASLKGGGSGYGSVGDDASAALSQSQRQIMERGKSLGMKMTPGQASGSKALQQFEAKLESQPMTSGPFNATKANNAKVLNREAAAAIGEASDSVDSATLDKAFTRISDVFEDAKDDIDRAINPQDFLTKYSDIQEELRGITTGFESHPLVTDVVGLAKKGAANGKQLQSLTSKLGKAAYKQMTSPQGDRDLGQGLYQLKDYVDDLLESGMDKQRAATFGKARQQYRNLMLLTSRSSIVNPSTGDVSGPSLAKLLQMKDKKGFLRGKNQSGMYDAARFAQAFQPIVGNSGTATRSMVTNPLELALGLPFNLASRAYASAPSVALATGVAGAGRAAGNAAGPLARRALGTAPYYAPFLLPGAGGIFGSQLTSQ